MCINRVTGVSNHLIRDSKILLGIAGLGFLRILFIFSWATLLPAPAFYTM